MARPRPPFDTWPLLPRPAHGRTPPADEPLRAAATACAGLLPLFLVLHLAVPDTGLGPEMARLVALTGSCGGFGLSITLLALLVGAAAVAPMVATPAWMRDAALGVFDHVVHLAFVLSVAGVLGIIVLHGRVPPIAIWFIAQAALLWACHRTRLWLAGPSRA